jgi:hypothetical protein
LIRALATSYGETEFKNQGKKVVAKGGYLMAQAEAISADGSWKVVVEAWSTSVFFFYSAVGITTRVYVRGNASWWDRLWGNSVVWSPTSADSVSASGLMASSQFPLASAPLPGSPNNQRNDSKADCRAWALGASVKFTFGSGGISPSGGKAGISTFVDQVRNGFGGAIRNGQSLSVGPVNWP